MHSRHSCQSCSCAATALGCVVVHFECHAAQVHQCCDGIALVGRRIDGGAVGHLVPVEDGVGKVGALCAVVRRHITVCFTANCGIVPKLHHLRLRRGGASRYGTLGTELIVGFFLVPLGGEQRADAIFGEGLCFAACQPFPFCGIGRRCLCVAAACRLDLHLVLSKPFGQRRRQVGGVDGRRCGVAQNGSRGVVGSHEHKAALVANKEVDAVVGPLRGEVFQLRFCFAASQLAPECGCNRRCLVGRYWQGQRTSDKQGHCYE